ERERDRQTEQRLRADERARTILESITDAFFATDREFNFTHANPQGEQLLGRKPGELIGLNLYKEYAGIVGTDFDILYRAAARDGKSGCATIYYPDHARWYEAHAYPSAEGMSVFFRDVSEAKRAEEAIRRSEQRLAAVVQTALDCVVGMDHEGHVIEWNPAAESTFGYTRAEAIGQEMARLIIPAVFRDRHREGLARYLKTGDGPVLGQRLELAACRKDGTEFPVELSITRVLGDGPPVFTGYLRDISGRKQAEAEREQLLLTERAARSQSERASRMKDEFLATLSHEIRTPLNAILGWSQIMQSSADPADIANGLQVIERNARAQAQIIEDLLDMSRIISGKIRLDVQRLDLSAVVHTAIEALRPTADAKSLRLKSVIDPLQGVVVSGDISRLQQVLWNLLSNAIKFTPKGGRVQVLLERVNSHLEISVIDSGEGIEPEFLPYVFDRFRQADASTTRRHGGLGIGLSIVKQLVELHGGSIRVKSAGSGHGATFIVTLPLIVVHAEPEGEPERRHPRVLSAASRVPDACDDVKGLRVLVVDDEPDARALVKRLLEDCHAVVTTTGSVDEAIKLIEAMRFDVLVSDIGMPDEDGYALIRRVRLLGKDNGGDIPAIALTAYARAEDRVKAVSAGFQMHVAKPVEPVELVTMVAGAAGRTGPTPA
ncbi:MAG: rpfC, partial [Phycisphaerales bacterium]|nr:rpfC [Phycisphaerales bacterium]